MLKATWGSESAPELQMFASGKRHAQCSGKAGHPVLTGSSLHLLRTAERSLRFNHNLLDIARESNQTSALGKLADQ